MDHRVTKGVLETPTLRVDGEIAGVIGSQPKLCWPHMQLPKYYTIKEQLSCKWLGCGEKSRIAWSLQDHSKFLMGASILLSPDPNPNPKYLKVQLSALHGANCRGENECTATRESCAGLGRWHCADLE